MQVDITSNTTVFDLIACKSNAFHNSTTATSGNDDEFSTDESLHPYDSYDSQDSDEEKPPLTKRLKLVFKTHSFAKGFITAKLSSTKKTSTFPEDSVKKLENEPLVKKQKKRIRKNKPQADKTAGDAEISTTKDEKECEITTIKEIASCSGKYGTIQKKSEMLCEICIEPLYYPFKPLTYHAHCLTWFHQDCFRAYLRASIDAGNIPIQCPQEGCSLEINDKKIVQILGKSGFASYLKKAKILGALKNLERYVFCATPNCEHLFELPPHDSPWDPQLNCPSCSKSTCGNCRVAFHKNITCVEYNTYTEKDYQLCAILEELQFKRCVKCRFWIEKAQGCNYMRCRCGYAFCYVCASPGRACYH